ncbi:neuronal acetylcholine receptor subunit beta-2-like [Haemaphysalis longicornis]
MGTRLISLAALCFIIGRITVAGTEVPDSEERYVSRLELLKRRLLRDSGYDATARPVNNTSEPTAVHIAIIFPDITHVALEDGWFTLKLWFCSNWYDHRITWNAEDYNRTFHITAKLTEVWWPKLDIVNARGQDLDYMEDTVVLHPDGHIWVCPAFSVKAACAVDLSLFPNDEQVKH